jgi:hypothetical protein
MERRGVADLLPKYSFPIIETSIRVGESVPERMEFQFMDSPKWERGTYEDLPIKISNDRIYNEGSSPRVEARLQNTTARDVKDFYASVVLYGEGSNAIAVSKTKIDVVKANSNYNLVFSWPEAFGESVLRKDIIILPK